VRITYFVSAGTGRRHARLDYASSGSHGSIEVGQQASIVLGGDATELLVDDNVDRTEGVGAPPVRELLPKLRDHAVPVFVRRGCAVARGATDEDLTKVNGTWVTPPKVATLLSRATAS
jgi:DsrE/DsrF/DsrH-like protein